jgi:hypothetical protein
VLVFGKALKGTEIASPNNTNLKDFTMEMELVFGQIDSEF